MSVHLDLDHPTCPHCGSREHITVDIVGTVSLYCDEDTGNEHWNFDGGVEMKGGDYTCQICDHSWPIPQDEEEGEV